MRAANNRLRCLKLLSLAGSLSLGSSSRSGRLRLGELAESALTLAESPSDLALVLVVLTGHNGGSDGRSRGHDGDTGRQGDARGDGDTAGKRDGDCRGRGGEEGGDDGDDAGGLHVE